MSLKSLCQPELRKSLTQEEERKLSAFGVALLAHMRELMLRRKDSFHTLDEVYLKARQEEMDVHLARLDPSKPSEVLGEQIDHVAHCALGVIDLSGGNFNYSAPAIINHEVYA